MTLNVSNSLVSLTLASGTSKMRTVVAWLCMLGLVAGCSSAQSNGDSSCTASINGVTVSNPNGILCRPSGMPFVVTAVAISDLCGGPVAACDLAADPPQGMTTAILTQPESGKVCLSGTAAPGGFADLILQFTTYNAEANHVVKKFDADSLGITKATFAVDSPPSAGVNFDAAVITSLDCPTGTAACFTGGFKVVTPPSNPPLVITDANQHVVHFADFAQTFSGASTTFDTSALENFDFSVGGGAYDFCVRDFAFLNAAGTEVKP